MLDKKIKKTVAVIFGGVSYEREISVLTGVFVLNVLKNRYNAVPVYIDGEGDFYTSPTMFKVASFTDERTKKGFQKVLFVRKKLCKCVRPYRQIAQIDCAINCCHGGWGEGGGISALMEIYDVPLASPDLSLSGVFMDKVLTKYLVAGMGIASARFTTLCEEDVTIDERAELKRVKDSLGFPLIVKPAHLGSSIGISVAGDEESLQRAVKLAFCFDKKLLIEEYLPEKRDINCAAYAVAGEVFVSECEEPVSKDSILSFREKYLTGGKTRRADFPAKIPEELSADIRRITEKIYRELHFSGMVRADFILSEGKIYFNEMNTVPGSLAYYLFSPKICDAEKLFSSLIEDAILKNIAKPVYETEILKRLPDVACVMK